MRTRRLPSGVTGLIVLACALPLVGLLGPVLFMDRTFLYRDSAHYYFPLWQYIQEEWWAGRWPLWNPYENLGQPLWGDASAAVCYPGKLLFFLPVRFSNLYGWYIGAHIAWAIYGVYLLSRSWGRSPWGSALGGLAYGLSGHILFQYCNVIYLVGAAWLPWAVLGTDRALCGPLSVRQIACGAIPPAMMVLGGDPQTAYHWGLAMGLYVLVRRWRHPGADDCRLTIGLARSGLIAGGAILLSAVQILPSVQWTRTSHRALQEYPRSIWERISLHAGTGHDADADYQTGPARTSAILGAPAPGSHHEHTYRFSVGPWRMAEWFWPNIFGQSFPQHRRWLRGLPWEGASWTPSYYCGLLPIVLALSRLRWRRGPPQVIWLSWIAAISIAASFGWYGLGWWWQVVRTSIGHETSAVPLGPQVGGIYWWFATFLPGYVYFRYPAKWWTLACLALSLLAAYGWDDLRASKFRRRLQWNLRAIAGLSLAGSAGLWIYHDTVIQLLRRVPAEKLFGPLEVHGAWQDIFTSQVHSLIVAVALCGILATRFRTHPLAAAILLLITSCEIGWAHRWLLPVGPAQLWETPVPMATTMRPRDADERLAPAAPPPRLFRATDCNRPPHEWTAISSKDRQTDIVMRDRHTQFPKYSLQQRIQVLESSGSAMVGDWYRLLASTRQANSRPQADPTIPQPETIFAACADYVLIPNDRLSADASLQPIAQFADLVLARPAAPMPRAWFVRSESANADKPMTESTCRPEDADPQSTCILTSYLPNEVVCVVNSVGPGTLVLADQFYPGWIATWQQEGSDRHPVAITRIHSVMRRVSIPAGRTTVRFHYRPWTVMVGGAISGIALLGVVIIGVKFPVIKSPVRNGPGQI